MRPDDIRLLAHVTDAPLDALMRLAEAATMAAFGPVVTYSPKVFLPVTMLCRNVCHYCTFAKAPRRLPSPYLSIADMLAIARDGEVAGCREALFTLGDRPELRYPAAASWLADNGYASTLDYVHYAASRVLDDTGLLPHLNPGVMSEQELAMLRPVAASMGLMLETASERLCARGGPHFGSPDKHPAMRLATIAAAGRLAIPFTTGILIGIGETRAERLEALLAIRDLHREYGHIQEVIVQNFRAKPGTRMADATEPDLADHLWTIAAARTILGDISIQAPPNLRAGQLGALLRAGVNDWGGVSPVTHDHVNPEAAWPALDLLRAETEAEGRALVARLAIGPAFARVADRWAAPAMAAAVRRASDGEGMARLDGWIAGESIAAPALLGAGGGIDRGFVIALDAARAGRAERTDIIRLFAARGGEIDRVITAADAARAEQAGDVVTYVVNRNINYANICTFSCGFCAFSKSRAGGGFRDAPYVLDPAVVAERALEAKARGATEVCLQGGIHPTFDGRTYRAIVAVVHEAAPDLHIHAFSPLEIAHGAETLGLSLEAYLTDLRDAGLRSLPGTAAEILDDVVRARLSAGKISVARWVEVMRAAHSVGLTSTATIMFGHVDGPDDWATHLLTLRALQEETGGFTEFVPLPFVHARAPIWVKGQARSGPTFREAVLMHAVARLVLGPAFRNIQTSWTKMGGEGAAACLAAGANDLGGTLMNESITRAAGGRHGQEMTPRGLADIAGKASRHAIQRTTSYARVGAFVS